MPDPAEKKARTGISSSDGPSRRVATLYDAVAGRVGYEAFVADHRVRSAVYPEEVLFRRRHAPDRYEETDAYFANEKLSREQGKLPDSDLLKALHCYASHFYSRAVPGCGKRDFRSMDETALLAMGILAEEAMRQRIGRTGDLAFVEASSADYGFPGPGFWDGRRYRRSVLERDPSAGRGGNVAELATRPPSTEHGQARVACWTDGARR